jgi:hypothetical protein
MAYLGGFLWGDQNPVAVGFRQVFLIEKKGSLGNLRVGFGRTDIFTGNFFGGFLIDWLWVIGATTNFDFN